MSYTLTTSKLRRAGLSALFFLIALLTACGGGGGGGTSGAQMGGGIIAGPLNLTNAVTTLAGSAGLFNTVDGTGSAARFEGSYSVTTDGTNLYVADTNAHTIRQVVIATGVVTTIAGTAGTNGSTDGTGTAALFNNPASITTDGTNLYVGGLNTIRKIVIATGVVTTIAGVAGTNGTTDGTGTAARFGSYPWGITTDGTNLYVSDTHNHTIRKIVIATGVVTTLAGTAGTIGSADGTGTAATFYWPYDLTTDGTNLYVAEDGNNIIRKIVIATGVVTTIAGTAGTSGGTDGTGAAARFASPAGIATDGTNLYVANANTDTIRKIVIATSVVTTIAGTSGSPGSTDGTGAAARFDAPWGLTSDSTSLYVTDYDSGTIRKID